MSPRDLFDRLLHRDDLDQSLNEEIQFHIGQRARDLAGSGMTPQEAERRARIEFGSAETYKEQCREIRRFNGLHTFLADIRFGLRMLRRSPGFSILAILCLTLGIGATTSVFSWIEGILLRPYPLVAAQDRMVAIAGTDRNGRTDVSWPDFEDYRKNCRLVESFVAEHISGTTLSIGE